MRDVENNKKKIKRHVDLTKIYGIGKVACPWHEDSNPSCHIYPDGAYCFSCGGSGDQIQFVQDYENKTFIEAMEMLMEYIQTSPIEKHKDWTPINESVLESMVNALWNPPRQEVFEYLLVDRKLTAGIIDSLKIGWDEGKKSITIPYIYHGQVRNIKSRVLPKYKKERQPKYRGISNKPFNWLFPVDFIRKNYANASCVFITEGEFDAMALLSEDLPALSLPNGASSNVRKYLRTLRLYDIVYFLYDMDKAGDKAAEALLKEKGMTGQTVYEAAKPTVLHRIRWDKNYGKDVTDALENIIHALKGVYEEA